MQTEKRASSKGATFGLAILFGVVGVSLEQGVAGFVVGAAIGALFAQILYLRSRAESLEAQLRALAERLADRGAPDEAQTKPSVPLTPVRQQPAPAPAPAAAAKPAVSVETVISRPMPRPAEPPRPREPTPA